MAISKPVPVPQKKISTIDVTNFAGGLFLGGAQNGPANAFIRSKDVELDRYGFMIPRRRLVPFLPATPGPSYQKFPVLWGSELYYFTASANKIIFCKEGDTSWTECGGANTITTDAGGKPKFIRVLNIVYCLNGDNGEKLCYADLATSGFPVVKYSPVTDPTTALTSSYNNIGSGSLHIYYAYSYSGTIGKTAMSPILDVSINKPRDQWQLNNGNGSLKLSRPAGSAPAGALFWNLHVALAATSGSIQPGDMLPIAEKLDLNTHDFIDDGTLDINLGAPPQLTNNTDGPRVADGIVEDGNPILYRDKDNPYNIWIGGGGPNAIYFDTSNGGYRAEPEKGTNYYASAIVGFRTGQGVPALTVLYSNTEGLSKQSVLQQQTVNYGDQSFSVWGVTEQHYGAAGVAAPSSPVNYNSKLMFLSTDGFVSAQTQPTLQNVLSILPVSTPVDSLVRSIKNSAMPTVVGTGWNGKYLWLIPSNGYDTPQQIAVLDTNNKGVDGNGAWDTLDIPANWIGVISPQNSAAFVYISQGNQTYKLLDATSTYDTIGGVTVPYSTNATGTLISMGGQAHNSWQATVQAMFYIMNLIGTITVGVTYRNQNGVLKTKRKIVTGPAYSPTPGGGWGDMQWTYANGPLIPGFRAFAKVKDGGSTVITQDRRIPVVIDDISSEAQWFFETPASYNNYKIRSVSYEGIDLGVRPDLQ